MLLQASEFKVGVMEIGIAIAVLFALALYSLAETMRKKRVVNMDREPTKQVIVMRNDLNMRKGKMIAQGAHASISFLTRRIKSSGKLKVSAAEQDWLDGSFAKVCVRVDSEEELLEIFNKAKVAGLEVHLITDSGKTEFHGEPTNTCLAIGPDVSSRIDKITGHLQLL